MRRLLVNLLAAIAVVGLIASAGAAWYVFSGRYNIAAAEPHFELVRWALDRVYRSSVREQAAGTLAPELGEAEIAAGASVYAGECARCHAAPGGERSAWVEGLRPTPPHLPREGTGFDLAEIHWLVENGARMTAMPAWQGVLSDEELWSVAAFVNALPDLGPDAYQEMLAEAEDEKAAGAAGESGTDAAPDEKSVAEQPEDAAGAPAAEADTAPAAAVEMTNALTFEPAEITIRAGESVRWTNPSDVPHTVTADASKAADPAHVVLPDGAEPFDSGMIDPGGAFTHTFEVPGRYRYFCIPHEAAGMIGEIVVEE